MAVTNYKVSFFFEGVQPSRRYASSTVGWTETWYYALDGGLDAMLDSPDVGRYILLRKAFMPSLYRIAWVRAADMANPRSSKTLAVDNGFGSYSGPPPLVEGVLGEGAVVLPGVPTPTVNPTLKPSQVTCAVLVDFVRMPVGGPGLVEGAHHRRFLIRGLPDDLINGNVLNLGAQSYRRMRAFLDYVGNHQLPDPVSQVIPKWLMAYQPAIAAPGYSGIALLTIDAGGRTIVLTPSVALPAGAQAPGAKLKVYGLGYMSGINRIWTVLAYTPVAGTYSLGTSRKQVFGTLLPGTGKVRFVQPAFGPANQYLIIGMRTKHTGRPFRLTRGKRRVL
jgi:hypothetical protein